MELLTEKLTRLPNAPGVYLMKSKRGDVIYVGKAKNLKNRLGSYFQNANSLTLKTKRLVRAIDDFDVMITQNEVEALLLERTLIRKHLPAFNILLRDDKQYPLLRVDYNEPWPRITVVRKKSNDLAKYVGPFASPGYLRMMLESAYKIFPLIRCTPHEFANAKRPCNYYHMRMCLAPCSLPVQKESYLALLQDALDFVQGKNKILERSLKRKMLAASESEDFEKAAAYRDQLKALKVLSERQFVVIKDGSEFDAVVLRHSSDLTIIQILFVRDGRLVGKESFVLANKDPSEAQTLESIILQYYDGRPMPKEIILEKNAVSDRTILQEAIHRLGLGQTLLVTPMKGEKKAILDLAIKNIEYSLQSELEKNARTHQQLLSLQEMLNLETLPKTIECIDVSHTQGDSIVASDVCFVNGKPNKNFYKRYTIKQDIGWGGDDFASIREVVKRRLERGIREDDLPDLLIIDGGKGQLNAALNVLSNYPGLRLPIVSLAKSRVIDGRVHNTPQYSNERVFVPGRNTPIPLKSGSPEYRLLTHARDEAHRFAVSFHRKKRVKAALSSKLEEIPGVGPKTRATLFQRFETLENIQKASYEALCAIPGIHAKTAQAIRDYFDQNEGELSPDQIDP